ncbi:MAG TPA: DUF4931 domain-containing protein [Thermoanaerobaculia bacterium]
MPIRRNPLTNEPIVFAPARASRPHALSGDASEIVCPFCPGNEDQTPPEIARAGDPWRVRVFPNKYPSVENAEVIVESADHDAAFERIEHAEEVVATYIERRRAHASAEYVALFKNEGERAGASIPHGHSQVMPLDFTPPRIAREAESFREGHCPLCDDPGEVIGESASFIWLAPHGSSMPYQQWLVPRRHTNRIGDDGVAELAMWLRRSASGMRALAPAFNWAFVEFPRHPRGHWYVDLFPRLTAIAGFELGTGTFVEIIDPAAAARHFGS